MLITLIVHILSPEPLVTAGLAHWALVVFGRNGLHLQSFPAREPATFHNSDNEEIPLPDIT